MSWAPDIYNIPKKVKGTRILSSTAEASKLIADVWAVRADFARDHADIIKGLVAGIFEGMETVKKSPDEAVRWMSEGFSMSFDEVKGMLGDAHTTNFAENREFFTSQNNPTNFENTWKSISYVYREIGLIGSPARFDQVIEKATDTDNIFSRAVLCVGAPARKATSASPVASTTRNVSL